MIITNSTILFIVSFVIIYFLTKIIQPKFINKKNTENVSYIRLVSFSVVISLVFTTIIIIFGQIIENQYKKNPTPSK